MTRNFAVTRNKKIKIIQEKFQLQLVPLQLELIFQIVLERKTILESFITTIIRNITSFKTSSSSKKIMWQKTSCSFGNFHLNDC